jgi:copper chaperone
MTRTHLTLANMTCNHCVMSVRKTLASIDHVQVEDVRIGEADVEYDEAVVREDTLIEALRNAGYPVVEISK